MAQLEKVQGAMLQMQREDDPYLTWGAPGCAVLPDGTFFVIAHTEFKAAGTYGFQAWRLGANLEVLDYQLNTSLTDWSPLYVIPLEDYVVQVNMSYRPGHDARVMLFDCSNGGARIMANNADPSTPDLAAGIYSYLYTTHVYLREFGIAALVTSSGVHLYRRGQLIGSASNAALGMPSFTAVVGVHQHPTDASKFAIMHWGDFNNITAYEVTVTASGGLSASTLWTRSWAVDPTDYVLAMASPYADEVWGWVSDGFIVPTSEVGWNTYGRYYLRSMSGGAGTPLWDRPTDTTSNNNVTRAVGPNLMLGAVELYQKPPGTLGSGVPNYGEEFFIATAVVDTGHGAPSARMIPLSRRDLVKGPGVPFDGYEDVDDVRNGSQYAPAYRDGTLLLASCPVYRAADNVDRFPVLVWKLEGVGHAEFGAADDAGKWLPVNDGISPGRVKVHDGTQWLESVTADTWDQEWKPLKINTAEEGQEPTWRTVALLTPSQG